MADILPTRPDPPSDEEKEPRVVGLDSDEVSDLLSAISSETARTILSALHDEPATPSEVADAADTSIQNAQYHLGKLEDAGLIEPGGTAYSEKGREMTVYAPADRALVVVAGQEDDTSGLQTVLTQLLGGLGVVALGSVVVERLTQRGAGPAVSLSSGGDGGDVATSAGDAGGSAGGAAGGANATAATATAEPGADAATATATATQTPAPEPTSAPTPTPTDGGGGGFHVAEATTAEPTGTAEATRTAAETVTQSAATGTPTEPARATSTETVRAATETMQAATTTPTQTPAPEPTATAEATRTAVETVAAAGDGGVLSLAALSPGELFLLGGLVTLAFTTGYWWLRG